MRRSVVAWAAHAYTASGLLLAAGASVLVVDGGPESLRRALLLLWIAAAVDASDGWLARRADVRRALPGFDGRRLDDLVDFHTYVSLPLLLLWRAGQPGGSASWLLLLPLLASAYGFSQTEAKTSEGFFRGFPSLWNVVAFYLFILTPPVSVSVTIVVGLAVLTFVPSPYIYPSHPSGGDRWLATGGAAWAVLVLLILLELLPRERLWTIVSLAFPVWYLGASWFASLRGGGRAFPREHP